MNTSNLNNHLEPWWATYGKATGFLVPALSLWAFCAVFLFPKVQEICRDAGFMVPASFRVMIGLMIMLRDHGIVIFGAVAILLTLLEWRFGKWPRYRRTAVGVTVFQLNSAVLTVITVFLTLALMGAPALFHTK